MSLGWKTQVPPRGAGGELVRPQERVGMGAGVALAVQHLAIALATAAVFARFMQVDLNLALLMTGIATVVFLMVVKGKVPGYLGVSAAFIPAVLAIRAQGGSTPEVMGAVLVAGLVACVIGMVAHIAGGQLISALLPPPVAGAIMIVVGLNLAPMLLRQYWASDHTVALITLVAIMVIFALSRGVVARIALPLGLAFGVLACWMLDQRAPLFSTVAGQNLRTPAGAPCLVEGLSCSPQPFNHARLDFSAVADAAALAKPTLDSPTFTLSAILLALPFVLAVLAETTSHVKSVAHVMDHRGATGTTAVYRPRRRRSQPLIPSLGRALMGVGLGTVVSAGVGGGPVSPDSGSVKAMASTRVLSTLPLYLAAGGAVILGFFPKVGALLAAIPTAVIGGVALVMCGLIALLGARLWVENRVDFSQPTTVVPLAAGLIIGIGDLGLKVNEQLTITGAALGVMVIVVFYHLLNLFAPTDASPTHAEETSVDWQDTSPVSLIDLRQYERGQAGAAGYRVTDQAAAPAASSAATTLTMPGVPAHLQGGHTHVAGGPGSHSSAVPPTWS